MAYENTHLWAADAVRERLQSSVLKKLITDSIDCYYFGAVFPDTLSYSNDKKIREISNFLHGKTGIYSNDVVFEVLDMTKRIGDKKNLAFICGFLTHCAMDIVFHPIIVYFSGYKPSNRPWKASKSAYLHWHYETYIDKRFNNNFYLDKIINPGVVRDLAVSSILNISEKIILDSLTKQISYFRRNRSQLFYKLYRMLNKTGLVERKYLAGFYANLEVDPMRLPDNLHYRDIISGENKETTMDGLMDEGINMGLKMVESAYDYNCGKINRQVCEETITRKTLDTGHIDKTNADVRFSLDI
jgi:hypothetical protein